MLQYSKHKFEPGAMSIIQMGEEQIGHPSTAINELVKNAYDADAGKCWVYTQYDKDIKKSFMIIKDNGLGMSSDILFGDWLRPSVSSKRDKDKKNRRSEIFNRRFLGSKGIGRLASMALGRYLTVISKQNSEDNYNWIRIDREQFKVEELLNTISFPGGEIFDYKELFVNNEFLDLNNLTRNGNLINIISNDLLGDLQEGTMIVVQLLDDSISTIIEDEYNSVETIEDTSIFKSLRDLITPLQLNSKLQKELVSNEIIKKELKIDNDESTFELFFGSNFIIDHVKKKIDFIPIYPSTIIDHYDYRVFGKISNEADVIGKYLCKRFESDKINEEFILPSSYCLSDENLSIRKTAGISVDKKYQNSNVGEFYFDIRIYDLDSDAKENMVNILNAKNKKDATNIFSKYLGLKVSKNGFGIKPYGEEERDWLGLGAKRVQKHIETIGPNQIIGNVFLYSPQNDSLSEKTNREGFFENKAFITFKKILDGILEETGRKRANYRRKHNLGRITKSKLDRPNTQKFIQYILESSDNDELISKTKKFVEETNTVLDNMENSLSFSQRLAGLGTGLELVYHEMGQPLTSIGGSINGVNINALRINDESIKEKILKRSGVINSALDALQTLHESLQPAIGKSIPRTFKPIDTINKICFLFKDNFFDKNIIIEIGSSLKNLKMKDYEYILWISFLNIVNNAVYWLSETSNKRVLLFEYVDDTFIIWNTGPLIKDDDLDNIFNYGVTGKKEKNATGLGLAFTRNLLYMRNWEIWAENKKHGPAFFIKKKEKK